MKVKRRTEHTVGEHLLIGDRTLCVYMYTGILYMYICESISLLYGVVTSQ